MNFNFKKLFILLTILSILLGINYVFSNGNAQDYTTLKIENLSNDTITAYLTLDDNGDAWISDVNGIFGIKSDKKLQGGVILAPKQILSYTSDKPIAGNISFNQFFVHLFLFNCFY